MALNALMHGFWLCIGQHNGKAIAADILSSAERFVPLTDSPEMYMQDVRKAKAELEQMVAA